MLLPTPCSHYVKHDCTLWKLNNFFRTLPPPHKYFIPSYRHVAAGCDPRNLSHALAFTYTNYILTIPTVAATNISSDSVADSAKHMYSETAPISQTKLAMISVNNADTHLRISLRQTKLCSGKFVWISLLTILSYFFFNQFANFPVINKMSYTVCTHNIW